VHSPALSYVVDMAALFPFASIPTTAKERNVHSPALSYIVGTAALFPFASIPTMANGVVIQNHRYSIELMLLVRPRSFLSLRYQQRRRNETYIRRRSVILLVRPRSFPSLRYQQWRSIRRLLKTWRRRTPKRSINSAEVFFRFDTNNSIIVNRPNIPGK
jgi:hypothetical protein